MDRRERIGDSEESLRMALDGSLSQVWTALPGIIVSADLTKMTATIQPAIRGSQTSSDGSSKAVNMPVLTDVPLQFPTAGGFSFTLPIKAGDEVLVIFASRCIDGWYQSGGIQNPIEDRMHDLSDGFAIVGIRSQPRNLTNVSATNAQLRSDDGSTFIEIAPSGNVKIKSSTVTIDSPAVTMSGTLTVTGALIAEGINLKAHTHPGVTAGTANTGAAQ